MQKIKFSGRNSGGRLALWLATAVLSLGVADSALAALTGIANTKHNLSSGAPGTNINKAGGTTQVCVFCHTPHGSDTTGAVPLWNKKLPGTSYTTYNSVAGSATSTIDGQILTVGSVSLACLSCHDGTQAMDNTINAPGSGGYNAAGAAMPGASWSGADQTAGKLINAGTSAAMLSADLTNDHPIGIQYCGGGLTGSGGTSASPAAVSGTCADSDFNTAVLTASVNSKQIFWIEAKPDGSTSTGTGRQKGDIALYTRDFTAAAGTPSVECGSCHDPHVESKSSDNIMFMRVTTAGSAICLACHVK